MITPGLEANDKLGSRYEIVLLASQRAKQLQEGAAPLIRTKSTHPLTIALEEIEAGVYPPVKKEGPVVDLDEEFIGAALAEQDLVNVSRRFETEAALIGLSDENFLEGLEGDLAEALDAESIEEAIDSEGAKDSPE